MKFKEMNLPNKLTTIRMWCVPLVIVLFALFLLNRAGIVSSDVYLFISYNNCEAEHCLVSKVSETYFLTLNQLLIAIFLNYLPNIYPCVLVPLFSIFITILSIERNLGIF